MAWASVPVIPKREGQLARTENKSFSGGGLSRLLVFLFFLCVSVNVCLCLAHSNLQPYLGLLNKQKVIKKITLSVLIIQIIQTRIIHQP